MKYLLQPLLLSSPIRFLFILLGPKGKAKSYHEIGRAIATLMSDEVGNREDGDLWMAFLYSHTVSWLSQFIQLELCSYQPFFKTWGAVICANELTSAFNSFQKINFVLE